MLLRRAALPDRMPSTWWAPPAMVERGDLAQNGPHGYDLPFLYIGIYQ